MPKLEVVGPHGEGRIRASLTQDIVVWITAPAADQPPANRYNDRGVVFRLCLGAERTHNYMGLTYTL